MPFSVEMGRPRPLIRQETQGYGGVPPFGSSGRCGQASGSLEGVRRPPASQAAGPQVPLIPALRRRPHRRR